MGLICRNTEGEGSAIIKYNSKNGKYSKDFTFYYHGYIFSEVDNVTLYSRSGLLYVFLIYELHET